MTDGEEGTTKYAEGAKKEAMLFNRKSTIYFRAYSQVQLVFFGHSEIKRAFIS